MWISLRVWAALLAEKQDLATELAAERAKVVGLERALAQSQANVDWMRVFANTMSQDRERIAAAKGIDLPGPRLEGRLQTPEEVKARAVERAAASGPEVVGRSLEEAQTVEEAEAIYKGHVAGFEDVGEEEAERLGIVHADDGTLEFTR